MNEMKPLEENWHGKTVEQVLSQLKTDTNGLSKKEAESRLQESGANELEEKKKSLSLCCFWNSSRIF